MVTPVPVFQNPRGLSPYGKQKQVEKESIRVPNGATKESSSVYYDHGRREK